MLPFSFLLLLFVRLREGFYVWVIAILIVLLSSAQDQLAKSKPLFDPAS
jgi:hypothetical protein